MRHFDYWNQLKKLHLYSLERRREGYIVIYIWRILEGQVPDLTFGKIYLINNGSNGDIAPLLKSAIICPILKPGSQRNHPKSYRPVSLTSHIVKIFERIIRATLVKYLEDNGLIPENQHGFIKGKSTLSQLLNHVEESIRNWEDGKATDTVYLDFAKAFDKVDHNILCHKLKILGITGRLGVWIREFFTGRTQRVSTNGLLSDLFQVEVHVRDETQREGAINSQKTDWLKTHAMLQI